MNEKMRVSLSELFPIIEEQLANGKEISFTPNGVSMLPLLRPGKDLVTLKSPPESLKKYDLPLYRRENSQFVLHRVVGVKKDGTYVMCGDNQYAREYGIKHSQIIGVVTSFERDGKKYSVDSAYLKFYAICRTKAQFVRLLIIRLKRKIKRILKKAY